LYQRQSTALTPLNYALEPLSLVDTEQEAEGSNKELAFTISLNTTPLSYPLYYLLPWKWQSLSELLLVLLELLQHSPLVSIASSTSNLAATLDEIFRLIN
jgi:hypothetical protein